MTNQRLMAALALWLCASVALGQAQLVDVSGTIAGIEGNVIAIKDATGRVFRAQVTQTWVGADGKPYAAPSAPSIIVTGTEDPSNLRPGHVIQFQAVMAGKKTVVGEVTAATLITPGPATQAGILSADPVEEEAAAEEEQDDEENAAEKKRPSNLERCLVVGQITRAKNNSITVTFPGTRGLTFRLADNATIDVSANNLTFARVGDKITAKGYAIALPLFASQDIKIEHTPLVEEKARPKPKPGKKGDDRENPFALGDPEADKDAPVAAAPQKKVKLEVLKVN